MGKIRYAWVTFVPMLFVLAVTMTAGWQKIFAPEAGGFVPAIAKLQQQIAAAGAADTSALSAQLFNNRVDIGVIALLMALVLLIVGANARLWLRWITGKVHLPLREDAPVLLTDPALDPNSLRVI